MTTLADEIERLAAKATPGEWIGYSEPEVGLPYSLFTRHAPLSIEQVEPLSPVDIDLVALLRNNIPTILTALRSAAQVREKAAQVADAVRDDACAFQTERAGCVDEPVWSAVKVKADEIAARIRAIPIGGE